MTDASNRARFATVLFAVVAVACAGCSSSGGSGSGRATSTRKLAAAERPHAVGELTETFVDTKRPTPAFGPSPQRPERTLVTTILYPAAGTPASDTTRPGAPPDRANGPYPLVAFSHGLGASPELYLPVLRRWAEAGFVVAAPVFPLTNDKTPGGPDAGDVVHQPGDISFVITSVLKAASAKTGLLAGLVDPGRVGAAGHSNGAITTVGLVANSCCHDPRVKAAVIMAGTAESYPGGTYDFTDAPPLLIVHAVDDQLIPYDEGVGLFNRAHGPKALLTVREGGHGAAAGLVASSSDAVVRASVDFLNRYLRGDEKAADHLQADATSAVTSLTYVPKVGSTTTIPTVPTPKADLHATVSPNAGLRGGQKVTVTWNGYTPGKVINILQCSADDANLQNQTACDFTKAALLHPDPTGAGSLELEIVEGKVGTGTCDATHQGCFVVVNNASSPDPAASLKIPITFGT